MFHDSWATIAAKLRPRRGDAVKDMSEQEAMKPGEMVLIMIFWLPKYFPCIAPGFMVYSPSFDFCGQTFAIQGD
jgi:hypothetical protein